MATQSISSSGTITFSGLASGMDTGSIISQLMEIERAPEKILTSQKTKLQNKVAEYNKLSSLLKTLQSQMAGINTSSKFAAKTVSVADGTIATATATGAAQAGNHTLMVTSLAASQTLVSQSSTNTGYASDTAQNFGTGTITIRDTTGGATDVTINIDSTNNSLQGIANAINSSGAKVTASVVNDGSGTPYRLALIGKDTNTYSVTASLTGGTYDAPAFEQKVAASRAVFQIDGIDMSRTSNTISDAIPGVTLNLQKPTGGSQTTVTIGNDTSAVTAKINDFITNYNNVMDLINTNNDYDTSTGTTGTLFGESTLRTVLSTLQGLLTSEVEGLTGNYTSLAELGISSDYKTGKISMDSEMLNTALSNDFNGVVSLFTQNTASYGLNTNQYGIAEQFNKQIDTLTHYYSGASNSGIVSTRIKGLNDSMTNIDNQIAAMEVRLVSQEKSLTAQFNAMESLLSNTMAWGNQLLAALGVNTSSSSSK
jgi:flagellar hook-associated protein 2